MALAISLIPRGGSSAESRSGFVSAAGISRLSRCGGASSSSEESGSVELSECSSIAGFDTEVGEGCDSDKAFSGSSVRGESSIVTVSSSTRGYGRFCIRSCRFLSAEPFTQ